eukprot:969936-Pleurochrysis_carterae.AAC.1
MWQTVCGRILGARRSVLRDRAWLTWTICTPWCCATLVPIAARCTRSAMGCNTRVPVENFSSDAITDTLMACPSAVIWNMESTHIISMNTKYAVMVTADSQQHQQFPKSAASD